VKVFLRPPPGVAQEPSTIHFRFFPVHILSTEFRRLSARRSSYPLPYTQLLHRSLDVTQGIPAMIAYRNHSVFSRRPSVNPNSHPRPSPSTRPRPRPLALPVAPRPSPRCPRPRYPRPPVPPPTPATLRSIRPADHANPTHNSPWPSAPPRPELERHETPVPVRSSALSVQFQGVLQRPIGQAALRSISMNAASAS